jgi:excisionase family DNA binding protein
MLEIEVLSDGITASRDAKPVTGVGEFLKPFRPEPLVEIQPGATIQPVVTLTIMQQVPGEEERQEKLPGSLLSTEEAANYLGVSAETLRRLCRRKAITFVQITPSEYRFDLNDLKEYVDSRRNRRKSGVR